MIYYMRLYTKSFLMNIRYWTLRVQMIAHLTRRINAPYRCSLKTLLFCINLDWKLSFLISKLIWTRSIFIHGSTQSQREVTGLFSSWSMASWWNERGASAPWSRRRPKRAVLFLWWSVSFSYEKKKWFKHLIM